MMLMNSGIFRNPKLSMFDVIYCSLKIVFCNESY